LKLSRIDLDGAATPEALVSRIFELEPDLPIPVPVKALCTRLDIAEFADLYTTGFEAALITDTVKSSGAILVAKGRSPQRRRFSIAHELGHFLLPHHRVPAGEIMLCSPEQLAMTDPKDADARRRREAEANRFAALLLMPPPLLRAELIKTPSVQIDDLVRLAALFNVSKDAFARAYVECANEAVAVVGIHQGKVRWFYRNERHFPWLVATPGSAVPSGSTLAAQTWHPREVSAIAACAPDAWLSPSGARKVAGLTEQVLGQRDGYALILLRAELIAGAPRPAQLVGGSGGGGE